MAKASKSTKSSGNGHMMPGMMKGHKPVMRPGQPPMHMMDEGGKMPSAPKRGAMGGKKRR